MSFQPRYLAYCQAHGKTPDEMMEHDLTRWPGGCMCGFLLWSNEHISKAKKSHPEWFIGPNLYDHDAYDEWLQGEVQA